MEHSLSHRSQYAEKQEDFQFKSSLGHVLNSLTIFLKNKKFRVLVLRRQKGLLCYLMRKKQTLRKYANRRTLIIKAKLNIKKLGKHWGQFHKPHHPTTICSITRKHSMLWLGWYRYNGNDQSKWNWNYIEK